MCNTKQRKACLERFVCICCMANHQSHNTNINIHLGATPDDKVLLPRGGLCLNLFQICTVPEGFNTNVWVCSDGRSNILIICIHEYIYIYSAVYKIFCTCK